MKCPIPEETYVAILSGFVGAERSKELYNPAIHEHILDAPRNGGIRLRRPDTDMFVDVVKDGNYRTEQGVFAWRIILSNQVWALAAHFSMTERRNLNEPLRRDAFVIPAVHLPGAAGGTEFSGTRTVFGFRMYGNRDRFDRDLFEVMLRL